MPEIFENKNTLKSSDHQRFHWEGNGQAVLDLETHLLTHSANITICSIAPDSARC